MNFNYPMGGGFSQWLGMLPNESLYVVVQAEVGSMLTH